jgi:hypothetical protein
MAFSLEFRRRRGAHTHRGCWQQPGRRIGRGVGSGRSLFLLIGSKGRGGSEHPDSDFRGAPSTTQHVEQPEEDWLVRLVCQYAVHQTTRLTHDLTGDGHHHLDKGFEFQT